MEPTAQIRIDFTPDDEAIARLHQLAFGVDSAGVDSAGVASARVEPWGDRLRQHSLTWAGAFLDDKMVAFVHIVWDGGIHGFLLDTIVHPNHQRMGLGRAVVGAAIESACTSGCEWLHVDFEPHLEKFYCEACGFERTSAGLIRLG